MDLNEISEIIAEDGGKFIIVENGKPVLVIVGFNEYKEKISAQGGFTSGGKKNPGNKEIDKPNLPEKNPEEGIQPEAMSEQNDEVDIDDLPLN